MKKIYKIMICLLCSFISISSFQITDVLAEDKDVTVAFDQSYDEINRTTDILVKPQTKKGFTISGIQKQGDIRFNETEKSYTVEKNGEYVFLVYYKDLLNKEQSEEFIVTVDTIEEEIKPSISDKKEEKETVKEEGMNESIKNTPISGVTNQPFRTSIPTDTKYFIFGEPNTITGYSSNMQAPRDVVIPETYVDSNGVTQDILHIGANAFEGQQLRSITFNINLKTIGNSSLSNNSLITQIIIPDSVTSLGDNVFKGCNQLTSVELGNGIKSIPDYCFASTGLTSFTIPDTVTSLGRRIFLNCWSLTNVEIGKGITSIPDNCFINSGLISITIPDTVTSLGYMTFEGCSSLTNVEIGKGITSIPDSCFSNSGLTSITIPDTVTSLGNRTFGYCSSLTNVEIGKGITSIGDTCFTNSGLTSITIPDTVTSLGNSTFYNCKSLTNVEIGKGITNIGRSCFDSTGLTSITIPDTVKSLGKSTFSGCSSLTNVEIGKGITSIPNNCFSNSGLTSITIPDIVTSLESATFSDCKSLTNVEIGKGITSIGDSCFSSSGLTSITIPDTVTSLGNGTFSACKSLTTVEIGKGITSIPDNCFSKSGLTSITIPDTVISLGDSTFEDCWNLTTVELGKCINDIAENAFFGIGNPLKIYLLEKEINEVTGKPWGATNAEIFWKSNDSSCYYEKEGMVFGLKPKNHPSHINCAQNNDHTYIDLSLPINGNEITAIAPNAFYGDTELTTVNLGKGITSIPDNCFSNSGLISITIPDTVTSLGNNTFYDCKSLANVEIGKGIISIPDNCFSNSGLTSITIPDTVTSLGNGTLSACRSLTSVEIGKGIISIPESCFSNSGLTSITIPDTVTSLGNSAFENCGSLTNIEIGKGITSIGNSCFISSGLTSIMIPDTVTSLGNSTFERCSSLTNVKIGKGITSIPDYCFGYSSLTSITIPDTVTSLGNRTFGYCSSLANVEIGKGITSIGDYCFDSTGLTSITIPDTVTNLGKGTFSSCRSLTNVEIGKGITSIPDSCFISSGLTSITIPDTVKSLGSWTFVYCRSLTNVEIGKGITSILDFCFSNSGLTSITIPDTVTNLGSAAFSGCKELTTVELGERITSIGTSCFANTDLTSILIPDTVTSIGRLAFSNTNLTDIQLPSSITNLEADAFKDTLIDTIYINQVRDACSFKGTQPWGAKPDAMVLYKGEFIDGSSKLMYSEDLSKAKLEHHIKAETGGYIKQIILPDGKVINNIDQENYKLEWEALKNEEYSFSVTSSYDNTRVFKVPVNNIEYIKLEAKNGVIPSNMVDEINEEGIIDKTNARSLLNYNKEKLDVSVVHPTIEEVRNELSKKTINEVTVTLKAEGTLPNDNEVLTETKKVKLKTSEPAFEVKFLDFDKNVLKTDYVYAGEDSVPPTKIPEKRGYLFTGWEKSHKDVQNNIEVNALFEKEKYKVTFKGHNGKVLKEEEVPFQENATAPTNPNQKGYTFLGWDKTFTHIEKDIVVNGNYSINSYKVTFKDLEGNVLKEEDVLFEGDATAPSAPSIAGYTFTGWSQSFTHIEENIVVKAKYSKNSYQVTFRDYDGNELKKENVLYQEEATAPKRPIRKGYSFMGWDKPFAYVEEDMIITALYAINTYKVTFKDHEGDVLKEEDVLYQEDASAPSAPSLKGYTFIGWSREFEKIESNIEVNAIYKAFPKWIGKDEITIEVGTDFNPKDYSAFEDADGNHLKDNVEVTINTVDVSQVGEYEVIYTVKDKWGATSEKRVVVIVQEKVEESKPNPTPNIPNDNVETSDQSNIIEFSILLITASTTLLTLKRVKKHRRSN